MHVSLGKTMGNETLEPAYLCPEPHGPEGNSKAWRAGLCHSQRASTHGPPTPTVLTTALWGQRTGVVSKRNQP